MSDLRGRLPVSKAAVETPVENLIKSGGPSQFANPRADWNARLYPDGSSATLDPSGHIMAKNPPAKPSQEEFSAPVKTNEETTETKAMEERVSIIDNPRVEPGKVRWHSDFAVARTRASLMKKPVLLFLMMGKLDDRFC